MAMGEAAPPCLMRSASHPVFASREGDPLRALTTSISFGRFLTEPLDWERWSAFSHNRTREDVQKHSRPGAVAEKKAFFEAYFNRFASKKSSKPPKKENKPPNYSPQTNASPVIPNKQSPTVATDENMCNRGAELDITSNQDVSSPSINLVFSEKRNVDDIISSSGQMEQEKISTGNVSSPVVSSNRDVERDISSNKNICSPLANLVFPETGNIDGIISSASRAEHEKSSSANLVFSEKGNVDDIISSNEQMEHEQPSTTNLVFSEKGNVDDIIISSVGRIEQEKTLPGNVNVSSENRCFQVKGSNKSSLVDKNKKKQSKDKISVQTKAEISSVRSSSRKTRIPEIHPKNQIIKHNPRVSSLNGVKKGTQPLPRSENKRPKPLLDRSVNGNKTVDVKSHSTNHFEALIAKKPRSISVPSSFTIKSDERAAKRKQVE